MLVKLSVHRQVDILEVIVFPEYFHCQNVSALLQFGFQEYVLEAILMVLHGAVELRYIAPSFRIFAEYFLNGVIEFDLIQIFLLLHFEQNHSQIRIFVIIFNLSEEVFVLLVEPENDFILIFLDFKADQNAAMRSI